MFCPICREKLKKKEKNAEGVFNCITCKGAFFILITTKPEKEGGSKDE